MSDEVVFTFHGIGEPKRPLEEGESDLWVDATRYADLVRWAAVQDGRVRLTFDDGNASDYIEALPRLVEAGTRATFFVLAGRLDEVGYLSTSQLKELASAGMTVGSHGIDHVAWQRLAPARLEHELAGSRARLEDLLGQPVSVAACPFGAYDRKAIQCARDAGYEALYTSDRGRARRDAFLRPRNSVRRADTRETLRGLVEHRPRGIERMTRAAKLWAKRNR